MMRISTTEARRRLAEIVALAAYKGQRTVLTHYGRAVAVVATVADLRKLDPEFERAAAKRATRTARSSRRR